MKINAGRSSIDGAALNVGTDIMLSKDEAAYFDDVKIGQGMLPYKVVNGEFKVGYILNPKINMMIEAKLHIRNYKTDFIIGQKSSDLKVFSIGLNTKLFNHYYDVPIHF